jgi:hypothetical protein
MIGEAAEIVHVVADPRRAEQVAAVLRATAQIYGHGTRIAVAGRACSIEAAVNAAVAASDAPLLVLFGAQAMPVGTDWLAAMLREQDAHPRAGLIAGRRIAGDLSIVDCGLDRETDADGRTRFTPRLAGFPVAFPAASHGERVAACARGAWLVRRSLFELVGGLGTDLLTSLGTDLDFSCRVRAAGFELRQLVAPDLLEVEDAAIATRDELALEIDQRLLLERWPFRPLDATAPAAGAEVMSIQAASAPLETATVETMATPQDAPPLRETGSETGKKPTTAKRRARKPRRAA